ncbi:MAG: Fic family protein [Candidatus Woesearchaeota archaeon]
MDVPEKPPKVMDILFNNPNSPLAYLSDQEVVAVIRKYNNEYHHWDNLKYRPLPKDVKREELWALMKFFRMQQYKVLPLCNLTMHYILTDNIQSELHKLDVNAVGNIESDLDGINNREKYIISSLMEEAIASSQLEGAATTRKLAKELLRKNIRPRNISEQMIVNGFSTMQKMRTMKENTLTPAMIIELQASITRDTLKNKEDEGKFRDNNDVVVADPVILEKVFHRPPDYTTIPLLLDELCQFVNMDTEEFIHPIVKGAILHFLIGYIHPFNDGNGRTARTLFYWYVLKKGYWLFEFMSLSRTILRSKTNYGLAYLYTETDDLDLTYFINYNLKCIDEALEDMRKYLARKQKEQREISVMLKNNPELNSRQASILKDFLQHPEKNFAIKELVLIYGIVYETARSDLIHLEKSGYIERITMKHKFYFKLHKNNSNPS